MIISLTSGVKFRGVFFGSTCGVAQLKVDKSRLGADQQSRSIKRRSILYNGSGQTGGSDQGQTTQATAGTGQPDGRGRGNAVANRPPYGNRGARNCR